MANTFSGGFFSVNAHSRQMQTQSAYTKSKGSSNPSPHLRQIAGAMGKIGAAVSKMPCSGCSSGTKKNCCGH